MLKAPSMVSNSGYLMDIVMVVKMASSKEGSMVDMMVVRSVES